MSNSVIQGCLPKDENCRTNESRKYNKDCYDFKPMNDGTKTGEPKYCQYSLECQQIDIHPITSKPIPMQAHVYPVADIRSGQIIEHRLLCTGIHDHRPLSERVDDEEAS